MKAFFRRLFCLHSDPRQWKWVRNYFVTGRFATVEEWQCQQCGKRKLFEHLF